MRYAAVAIVIVNGNILLIRRSYNLHDRWAGHIAFPGGHYKAGLDRDLLDTALREVHEEIGINLSELKFKLYPLSPVRSKSNPDLIVCPYLMKIQRLPRTKLSNEVDRVYWIHIRDLSKDKRIIRGEGREVYTCNIDGEEIIIWGLTKRIIDELIEVLHIVAYST